MNTLVIRLAYDAPAEDVWDAIADPERLVRWFLPVSGDLREGGRYSLEGNASGTITRCVKPREIALTWEYGGTSSDVRVALSPEGGATVLELRHEPLPDEVVTNAGDIWGVGAGWELGLVSLADFLAGDVPDGRAVDRMANASGEEVAAIGALAEEISAAWAEVLAHR